MDRMRVLVVDDEPDIVRELAVLLRRRGFAVNTAESVSGARKVLADGPLPHAIVSDVRMLDGSGLELLDDDLGETPPCIIYVSGHLDGAEAKAVVKRGALAVLPKPVDTRRLVGLLREHGTRAQRRINEANVEPSAVK
ncbi:MAG: response regulator [Alphaproteobacteria bacterium]|nr:response regulator [Alphaproteobacteria bacterium]